MSRRIAIVWTILGIAPAISRGQTAPPATDIYLAPIVSAQGRISVGPPTNLTDREGYDNQSFFSSDGSYLLYTSIREDRQADIYRIDLRTRNISRLTKTPESEYSATLIPGGAGFSVVRVEADSSQRLWKFDLEGNHPTLLLADIKPVGYHAWADSATVALFVLGNPPTLWLAHPGTSERDSVTSSIGRSLHKVPGQQAISFVHKVTPTEWWIKEFEIETKTIHPLTPTLAGSEDYAWTPGGTILMASGKKLYEWNPKEQEGWKEIADFDRSLQGPVTRIAVNPTGDRIAFVAARRASP